VLDTNVLVSAALGQGHSRRLLAALVARRELVTSDAILEELDETLRSDPRLRRLVTARLRARLIAVLSRASSFVDPKAFAEAPDPDDAAILGTAVAAHAPLVTGDKALLRARPPGLRIVTVREALEELDLLP